MSAKSTLETVTDRLTWKFPNLAITVMDNGEAFEIYYDAYVTEQQENRLKKWVNPMMETEHPNVYYKLIRREF